jgi:D-tyrosyl-tRNA(Tyr) deacylase
MRAVVQRVKRARVLVGDEEVGAVGVGLLILVGAMRGDDGSDVAWLARKLLSLRIFPDEAGKMNRSIREVAGECLVVSQFTLCADTSSGSRPSFGPALDPAGAERLVADLVGQVGREVSVATGRFGASMGVELVNDGPVTLWLDSRAKA